MNANAVAPPRRLEQRQAALQVANVVRQRRARMKAALTVEMACEFLVAPVPWWLATMKVRDLLVCVPKLGPVSVSKLLRRLAVADVKTIGGLTGRQRDALLAALRERA